LITSLLYAVTIVGSTTIIYFITDTTVRGYTPRDTDAELVRSGWTMWRAQAMRQVSVSVDTKAGVYMTTLILKMLPYRAISTHRENMPVSKRTTQKLSFFACFIIC